MTDILKSLVLQALLTRFPDRDMTILEGADEIGRFPAAYPNVGDLWIGILYDEVMVEIGFMTHLHFSADEGTADERSAKICEHLLVFMEALFADRVLLFPGGMWVIEEGESPHTPAGRKLFKWSGPL
jgi:hypothetical protein